MFINLVKKSFSDIIKNPIITLFLVIYFIVISLLLSCMGYQSNPLMFGILGITSFLFVAIFLSGWLGIIKEISLKNETSSEENQKSQLGLFLENIGENVIPFIIALVIYILFSIIFAYIAYLISIKLFGNPRELLMEIQSFGTPEESINFIKNLPQDKLIQLYIFPIALMLSVICCSFVFMYYFISMIFDSKTSIFLKPFIALKNNFCFLFKHFFMSLGLFLFLCIINTLVAVVKAYIPSNIAVDIIYIFYVIYFMSFAVMLICNYYGKHNFCDNGCNSVGEDVCDDKAGEEE